MIELLEKGTELRTDDHCRHFSCPIQDGKKITAPTPVPHPLIVLLINILFWTGFLMLVYLIFFAIKNDQSKSFRSL